MCWGHPQPQKLNWARASPPVGLLTSRSLKVLSNGIVTEDWDEALLMVFCPCFTVKCLKIFRMYIFWDCLKNKTSLKMNYLAAQIAIVGEKMEFSRTGLKNLTFPGYCWRVKRFKTPFSFENYHFICQNLLETKCFRTWLWFKKEKSTVTALWWVKLVD